MDYKLLDYAKEAEDTASGLHVFLSEIPQYSKDITGDIAELFAISNALHTLHEALDLSRYGRYSGRILRDLEVALPSLGYTLDDVRDLFSRSKKKARQAPGAFPGTPPYNAIWEDACSDFKAQGIALPLRLEIYRTLLQGLYDRLRGYGIHHSMRESSADALRSEPIDDEVDRMYGKLAKLLKRQEPVDSYFSRLNVGDPRVYGRMKSGLHIFFHRNSRQTCADCFFRIANPKASFTNDSKTSNS